MSDNKQLVAVNSGANLANRSSLKPRRVSARVIEVDPKNVKKSVTDAMSTPTPSKALPDDPFSALIDQGRVIEPPFDVLALAMMNENSTEMEPCLSAMEVNIEGFGHRFVPRIRSSYYTDQQVPEGIRSSINEESVRLQNFFQYCTTESFVEFRKKLRRDRESTGCSYFEVIRDVKGEIQSFVHLPSYQMRLGKMDEKPILVKRPILALQLDGSVRKETRLEWRRFRPFAQSRSIRRQSLEVVEGYKLVWFKEFGDPRIWDSEKGVLADEKLPPEKRANEIVYQRIYSTRTPYGLPRYIGNLLSIYGDRASEEINYTTFRNNNIPSMVISVSNGQLTDGSIDRITQFVESQIQDSDNYSKFLILEAEGFSEGEDGGQIKIEIRPLTDEQHKDALFQKYSEHNRDKIRRVWRLPPILVGRADDYTRNTADASRQLADEQIFNPERNEFDEFMNRIIFPDMGIQFHKFKSNSPNTTDNELLVRIMSQAEKTGSMNPRIARSMLEDIMSIELPEFPPDFNADVPFSLTMAEAVKNQAAPNEPGQQVTAIKSAPSAADLTGAMLVDYLVGLNKALEEKWRKEVETGEAENCSH